MSELLHDGEGLYEGLEPERYELREGGEAFELNRRDLLGLLGGGLLVLCLNHEAPAQESGGPRRRGGGGGAVPKDIEAWVHVGEDGKVTACTGKVEVGQNARTSLTMAVADELRLEPGKVSLVMGDTDRVPFDMGTFGSRTTPFMVPQLRRAAAAARGLLLGIAADTWGVERATLSIEGGKVVHPASRRGAGFGELTRGRKLVETIGEDVGPMPPSEWKVAGTSLPKVDARAFVTGKHEYTTDVHRPGMLRGKVLRAPALGAKLASVDVSRAAELADAKVVRDGDFVGVVAPVESTAAKALAALKPTWTPPGGPPVTDEDIGAFFKAHPEAQERGGRGRQETEAGASTDASALSTARVKVRASYTVAYIAHAPLEPRAAVAEWEGDRLTVWTGTQRPFGVRSELAQAFGMPEAKIRVLVPDTGSGYGGKHTGEAAVEAARLARAAGKPVKLVWTREEEFTWAYLRPAGLIEAAGAVDDNGRLISWEFHNHNSGGSALATPYKVPEPRQVFHPATSPLRQGSYRALAATANHFARESLMDELAHAAGIDPLVFRLRNLEEPRLRAVLEDAAERAGWGKRTLPEGHGLGIAGGTDKGGHVATCAEVAIEKETGALKVVRLATAFDCGAIVNPDHLRNQVEGAVVMGLGGALFETIRFKNGKILNPRFSRYRVPRFEDMPQIDVYLHDRGDLPAAGAGESPIVAVAPAIGNAIFAARGVRPRSMPMAPQGVIKA